MTVGNLLPNFTRVAAGNLSVTTICVLTACTILVLNLHAPANPTLVQRGLASLLLAGCALPTLLWASSRHRHHAFMPLLGVTYAISFVLPVFSRSEFVGNWFDMPTVDGALIDRALLLALTGWGLMLIGYFGPVGGWVSRGLPRINVLSTANRRSVKFFGLILGVTAALFLYIDTNNLMIHYSGKDLPPAWLLFPITFIGEMTTLAILIFFYLQRQGSLGRADKIFLWGLTAYYTLSGLSTGIMIESLPALTSLFVGAIAVTPTVSWRIVSYGALTAFIVLIIIMPERGNLRKMFWTYEDAQKRRPDLTHGSHIDFDHINGRRVPEVPLIQTSEYMIVLKEDALTYSFHDADTCHAGPVDDMVSAAFLHIVPVHPLDLPADRIPYGFDKRDFLLSEGGRIADGKCVHDVRLPAYAVASLRTGLYLRPAGRLEISRIAGCTMLTSFTSERMTSNNLDGVWGFDDSHTEWEISALHKHFLRIIVEDEMKRFSLAGIRPGSPIKVVVDTENWVEYWVDDVWIANEMVSFSLGGTINSAGDMSSLMQNVPASLHYPFINIEPYEDTGAKHRRTIWQQSAPLFSGLSSTRIVHAAMFLYDTILSIRVFPIQSNVWSLRRGDRLLPVAWIIGQTPENVPYLLGESYSPLLFKLVPRFIWRTKPVDGIRTISDYGFLRGIDNIGAFKVHQLGEMYANFGTSGVLFGMFVLGVLYRTIYQLFFHPGASVVTLAAGTHILTVLLVEVEAVLSASWGFVVWYVTVLVVIQYLTRVASSRWAGQLEDEERHSEICSVEKR